MYPLAFDRLKRRTGLVSPVVSSGKLWLARRAKSDDGNRAAWCAAATLGIWPCNSKSQLSRSASATLRRSRRFYVEGFGWTPVFENRRDRVLPDERLHARHLAGKRACRRYGAQARCSRAHSHWATMCRNVAMCSPPWTGCVSDRRPPAQGRRSSRRMAASAAMWPTSDDHAWEIAWNPAWAISEVGFVSFGV